MADVMEYKCPCCGGAVEFNSTIQKMKCPYCETEFDIEALENYAKDLENKSEAQMEWQESAGNEWQEGETEGMCVYICQSCGGEIIGDENIGSMTCPYCINNIVVKRSLKEH